MFADPGGWLNRGGSHQGFETDPNLEVLYRLGLTVAVALCVASFYPPAVFAAMLYASFTLAAFASGVVALLRAEPVHAPHLTLWDETAALQLLGLVAKAFIHQDAVTQLLKSTGALPW